MNTKSSPNKNTLIIGIVLVVVLAGGFQDVGVDERVDPAVARQQVRAETTGKGVALGAADQRIAAVAAGHDEATIEFGRTVEGCGEVRGKPATQVGVTG